MLGGASHDSMSLKSGSKPWAKTLQLFSHQSILTRFIHSKVNLISAIDLKSACDDTWHFHTRENCFTLSGGLQLDSASFVLSLDWKDRFCPQPEDINLCGVSSHFPALSDISMGKSSGETLIMPDKDRMQGGLLQSIILPQKSDFFVIFNQNTVTASIKRALVCSLKYRLQGG